MNTKFIFSLSLSLDSFIGHLASDWPLVYSFGGSRSAAKYRLILRCSGMYGPECLLHSPSYYLVCIHQLRYHKAAFGIVYSTESQQQMSRFVQSFSFESLYFGRCNIFTCPPLLHNSELLPHVPRVLFKQILFAHMLQLFPIHCPSWQLCIPNDIQNHLCPCIKWTVFFFLPPHDFIICSCHIFVELQMFHRSVLLDISIIPLLRLSFVCQSLAAG